MALAQYADAMTWADYVTQHAAGDRDEDIAAKLGISSTTVYRWRKKDMKPDAPSVAGFARAYGRSVIEAFVAAGFLTDDEAKVRVVRHERAEPDNAELVRILAERLDVVPSARLPPSNMSAPDDELSFRPTDAATKARETGREGQDGEPPRGG